MQKCYLHKKVKRERMMQNGDILSQLNMIHKSSNILIFTINSIKKVVRKINKSQIKFCKYEKMSIKLSCAGENTILHQTLSESQNGENEAKWRHF